MYSQFISFRPAWLRFEDKFKKYGEGKVEMDQSLLPFDISFESLKPKDRFLAGFNYSYTGVQIHLVRNNFKILIGSYYAPTAMFSILSLISFSINPDVVSNI